MQFGIALNISGEIGRSDAELVWEQVALGDLAEPLGFDSLFVLEHHFTGYIMSPAPFQLLAYYAGRTIGLKLGTAVIVLPWHDPVRVAEQVALLDILCGARGLFAFGRGRAELEYTGFRVPLTEARARFVEAMDIVLGLLTNEVFGYTGEFYQLPPLSIRPQPNSKPEQRFYGPSMGKESAEMFASRGFGMLLATQKEWTKLGDDVTYFHNVAKAAGYCPKGPIVFASISVATSRDQAHERALRYLAREYEMSDAHYHFSEDRRSVIKGYQPTTQPDPHAALISDHPIYDPTIMQYVGLQLVGTPDDCIQQIEQLSDITKFEHLILEFSYGGMPYQEAESNMRTFADEVMPAVKQVDVG